MQTRIFLRNAFCVVVIEVFIVVVVVVAVVGVVIVVIRMLVDCESSLIMQTLQSDRRDVEFAKFSRLACGRTCLFAHGRTLPRPSRCPSSNGALMELLIDHTWSHFTFQHKRHFVYFVNECI